MSVFLQYRAERDEQKSLQCDPDARGSPIGGQEGKGQDRDLVATHDKRNN